MTQVNREEGTWEGNRVRSGVELGKVCRDRETYGKDQPTNEQPKPDAIVCWTVTELR